MLVRPFWAVWRELGDGGWRGGGGKSLDLAQLRKGGGKGVLYKCGECGECGLGNGGHSVSHAVSLS